MIKVLVVDDSALVRRLVTTALEDDAELEVVGTGSDGHECLRQIEALKPDVVTLDIEMPVMDGLAALVEIRRLHPRLPVIMFSTLTERGAVQTLEALARGASDYVAKPSGAGGVEASIAAVRGDLVPRIKALVGARRVAAGVVPNAMSGVVRMRPAGQQRRPEAVVIGCSTGGPDALATVLPQLPEHLAVVVVQHMPAVFTAMLAGRLDRLCAAEVREAADGDEVRAGRILIAPGDFHLRLARRGTRVLAELDQGEPENFCRPAVDVLFRSAAVAYGGRVLAVLLTGMGQDGLAGARALAAKGAPILAQDQETSVVWGMPGAVASAGLAHDVLPLDQVADRITALATP